MLVVHPDSCCDICNESYDTKRVPHAIACGHIFCCDCLQKCTPSHCPVCRGGYRKEKIKKLHVETTLIGRDEISRISSPSAITEYLQMVAMISGEGVPDVEVENVSVRVDEWVASLPQNLKLQSQPVRLALDSVKRARKLQQELETARVERLATERKFDRVLDDVRQAKLVEDGLLQSSQEAHEQLELLQQKYDILMAERSLSPSRDRSNSRSKKQDESKTNGAAKPSHPEAVYTITPGAPHSERVLPSSQRKQVQKPTPVGVEPRAESRHNRSRSEQVPGGLGLHLDGLNSDWNGAEDHVSTPTMGSIPNASRRRLNPMNGIENFSILSPPVPNNSFGTQHLHEVLSSSASSSVIDVSTPSASTPSTLSWGTGSTSTISVGDMSLAGLPAFPSGSSLNLGMSGLPDFDHTIEADEADEYGNDENVMTPSLRRQPELEHDSRSDPGVDPRYANPQRFDTPPVAQNRRANVSRHSQSTPAETRNYDVPAPPRPMGRSISDNVSAMPGSRSLGQGDEELEVVGLRFSQSYSEAEPALYGYGSASTPSSFEHPAPIRSGVRRASIATPNVRGLDLEGAEAVGRSSTSPVPIRPAFHRSVTFSTPRPEELPSKRHRDQGPHGPSMHGPRGTIPNPNTAFPLPSPEHTKGYPISSRRGPGDDATRRGLATIAAPPRDLPPTFDPTYTAVGSNKRPLPSTHQVTPPPTRHARKDGQQSKRPAPTRAAPPPLVIASPIDVQTQVPSQVRPTVSANVPIVAPQPVNPIRAWKWNSKTA